MPWQPRSPSIPPKRLRDVGKHLAAPKRIRDDEAFDERLAILSEASRELVEPPPPQQYDYSRANDQACETPLALAMTAAFHGEWVLAWKLLRRNLPHGDEACADLLQIMAERVCKERVWDKDSQSHERKPKGAR